MDAKGGEESYPKGGEESYGCQRMGEESYEFLWEICMNLFAFWGRETKAKAKVVKGREGENLHGGVNLGRIFWEREMGEKE